MIMNFEEKSKLALDAMEEHAARIGTSGVGVFIYTDDEKAKNWQSVFRIIGAFKTIAEDGTGYNFISIAYSKVAESIETGKNSGTMDRPRITGEFGYQGSAIAKYEGGIIITSFSGSTGEIDFEIAKSGLAKVIMDKN